MSRIFAVIKLIFTVLFFSIHCRVNAQDTEPGNSGVIKYKPVTVISEPVKYSTATFSNITPFRGEAYGVLESSRELLKEFGPEETFELPVGNAESINFIMYEAETGKKRIDYSIDTKENRKYSYNTEFAPGLDVKGTDVKTSIKNFRKLKGNKIYDVIVSDDILPLRIRVEPTNESMPFVEVLQTADSSRYQVRLKSNNVVDVLLKDNKAKYVKQGFADIPIGVRVYDPEIIEHDLPPLKLIMKIKINKPKK